MFNPFSKNAVRQRKKENVKICVQKRAKLKYEKQHKNPN